MIASEIFETQRAWTEEPPYAYYIVCPRATADRPKIATFRNWLLAQVALDLDRLSRP
jgi:DNA-binding transcriptional LysR family regulator